MPRTNNPKEYVRAYHRAGAILRLRHLDEWNQIRRMVLDGLLTGDQPEKLAPGPGKGSQALPIERRIQNYDDLAREHQALKDALVISNSYLQDAVRYEVRVEGGGVSVWAYKEEKEVWEQIRVNERLIEETRGL